MAQQLRALTVLLEFLSSIPNNHIVAHKQLQNDQMLSFGVSGYNYNVLIYKNKKIKVKRKSEKYSTMTLTILQNNKTLTKIRTKHITAMSFDNIGITSISKERNVSSSFWFLPWID